MSDNSNFDLFAASLDEKLPRTPRQNSGYSRRTFFSRRELDGDFRFSPSAWKTPERRRTGETPLKSGTPHAHRASPSSLFGTPSAYRAAVSPSRAPRGIPGLHQSPLGNIGVTPARVMGPFPRRDLSFGATPPPSPTSVVAHRKIITPKRLRPGFNQAQKFKDGTDLLDTSLFGVVATPMHHPTAPFGGHSDLSATPLELTDPVLLPPLSNNSPPLEAAPVQSDVASVDGMDSDEEEKADTEEDGEDNEIEDEDEDEVVIYHTQSLAEFIHSQHGAQNGSTDDDEIVWLPFPYDRDNLVMYLEQGLSLRHLFPSSIQGSRIRCEAELELVGRRWRRADTCNKSEGSLESYQRHVKSKHLGVKRAQQVGVDYIVNTVWDCQKTIPKQPKTWLRVHRWDPQMRDFPLAA